MDGKQIGRSTAQSTSHIKERAIPFTFRKEFVSRSGNFTFSCLHLLNAVSLRCNAFAQQPLLPYFFRFLKTPRATYCFPCQKDRRFMGADPYISILVTVSIFQPYGFLRAAGTGKVFPVPLLFECSWSVCDFCRKWAVADGFQLGTSAALVAGELFDLPFCNHFMGFFEQIFGKESAPLLPLVVDYSFVSHRRMSFPVFYQYITLFECPQCCL